MVYIVFFVQSYSCMYYNTLHLKYTMAYYVTCTQFLFERYVLMNNRWRVFVCVCVCEIACN